jgi:glutaredoxin
MLKPRLMVTGLLATAAAFAVQAQQIYKIVGPDGRVTFSDQPPVQTTIKAPPSKVVPLSASGSPGNAALPFELRQAASRYPVTLFTAPGCSTCADARTFLSGRGVPFAEKTVTTNEDIEALRRLGGTALPFMTLGSQQLKGFSDSEWAQYLDAAGYPKTSQLPAGYTPPPAAPLVALERPAVKAAAAPVAVPTAAAAPQPAADGGDAAENPAGIKF